MRSLPCFIATVFLLIVGCTSGPGQRDANAPLFTYAGEDIGRDRLPDALRQRLYNAQSKFFEEQIEIVRESILDIYLGEQAQKNGKSVKKLKEELFKTTEPTEEQKKQFFETVKDRLPYSYAIIRHELGTLMIEEQKSETMKTLLREIEKQKNVRLYIEKPSPPEVELAIEGFPRKGTGKATVRLVEFGDFSCPSCRLAVNRIKNLVEGYNGKLEFVWRYFFLHPGGASVRLAKGGHCSEQQGKFWQYHDYVFDNQSKLRWRSPVDFIKSIEGFDEKKFVECFNDKKTLEFVTASHEEGVKLGVSETPTFFVNGKRMLLSEGFEGIEAAIRAEL